MRRKKPFFLLMATTHAILSMLVSAAAQDCFEYGYPVESLGPLATESPWATNSIAINGERALVSYQDRLEVVDLSDPAATVVLGSMASTYPGVTDVAAVSSVLDRFIGVTTTEFIIYEIDGMGHPGETGSVQLAAGGWPSVATNGQTAAVAAGSNGLIIIFLGDPANPVITFTQATNSPARGVDLFGSYIYVTTDVGLEIFHLPEPSFVYPVASLDLGEQCHKVKVAGDQAYVARYGSGLAVVDVSNPLEPALGWVELRPGSTGGDMAIDGNCLYIGERSGSKVWIYDLIEPGLPTLLSAYPCDGDPYALAAGNGTVLAGGIGGSHVFVALTPPSPLASLPIHGDPHDIVLVGDRAYVATIEASAVSVVDLAAEPHPVIIHTIPAEYGVLALAGSDDLLFVADTIQLDIYDLSDPQAPVFIGRHQPNCMVVDVVVDGVFVYLARSSNGIEIVAVASPSPPVSVSELDLPGFVTAVDVSGGILCAAVQSMGVHVVDVTNPVVPAIISTVPTTSVAVDVSLVGDILFVADLDGGLQVYDLADPTAPELVTTFPTAGVTEKLYWTPTLLYSAEGDAGYRLIDVWRPQLPTELGGGWGIGRVEAVAGSLDYLLVATADSMLHVLPPECRDVTVAVEVLPTWHQGVYAAPNPFNPRTEIRFTAPTGMPVAVDIFDLRGYLIRDLHRGTATGTEQRLTWDGCDAQGLRVASGTYLIVVRSGGARETYKVTLLQ